MAVQTEYALVLGGGGVTGIAWLTGVLAGLTRSGLKLPEDCTFIGTSAGSAVCADLANGTTPESLLTKQLDQTSSLEETFRPYSQRDADAKNQVLFQKVNGDLVQARQRVGAFALRSDTPTLDERRRIIQARLHHHQWPEQPLILTAVDSQNGDPVLLDKHSGLNLVDAVMASCAVPGAWPCVPLKDKFLMDGGLRSMTNADLAIGSRQVLILAPLGYSENNPVSGHLRAEVDQLTQSGATVDVITPDEQSTQAIGDNVLDPAQRVPSAEAGLVQGLRILNTLNKSWTS